MVKITFIEASGTEHVVDAKPGFSVMEAAIWNDVPGIEAVCGGACVCATCHVTIDERARKGLQAQSGDELGLLEDHEDRTEDSRLSCQIKVTRSLDGLVVRLPEVQRV